MDGSKFNLDLNQLEVSSFTTEPTPLGDDAAAAAVATNPIIVLSGPTVMTWCYVCPVKAEPIAAEPVQAPVLAPRLY